jgi:signal transduction histidine kinase
MAMVAHDLRNPLFAISGFTRFLLDREKNANLGKTQQAMIQRIHNAGEYMARLINQMMDFSKIEHGKLVLEMEQNDITVLVKERIELSEMAARNKDIQFRANLEEVPRFFFDNTRIEQVVDNLISNAIKYSPAGSVIDLSLSADDDQVEFSVKDEGPGISREDQKLLFGEFQTLSAKPTGGEECLGLGLNIVKGLVSLHGGEVAVDSELGKGARFFVWLPLRPSPAVLARAEGRSQKAPLPHSTH